MIDCVQFADCFQAKLAFVRFPIPKVLHPFISGPGNQWVRDLMERTGVRVNIPPLSVNSDDISIAGEKEGVAIAKDEILRIYEEKVGSSCLQIVWC